MANLLQFLSILGRESAMIAVLPDDLRMCRVIGGRAMWRFILLSFVFLGWSFYEMSGGADYHPSANSIQARVLLDNQRPQARPMRVNVIEVAQADLGRAGVGAVPSITSLQDLALRMDAPESLVTAAIEETSAPLPAAVKVSVPSVGGDFAALAQTARLWDQTGFSEVLITPSAEVPDLRQVAGTSVNLRSGPGTQFGRLTSLARGTEVIVLPDRVGGWVKVRLADSGDVGWMTDRLLTVAAE